MNTKPQKDQYIDQITRVLEQPSKFIREIIKNQIIVFGDIKTSSKLDNHNTFYEQKPFNYDNFCFSCNELIKKIPIDIIRNDFNQMVNNYPFYALKENDVMNLGHRLNELNGSIIIDEWCNVLNQNNPEENIFSIHKSFDATHYSIRNANLTRVLEISFNESFAQSEINKFKSSNTIDIENSKNEIILMGPSCSIYYMYYCNEIIQKYKITKLNSNEINIEHIIENKDNQENINKKKKILKIGESKQSHSDCIRTVNEYRETKETEKTFNEGGESFGKKKYENSCKMQYFEEWKRNDSVNGYTLKVHSFHDDGLGKKVTKDYGNKKENDIEMYNYCDTYTENISTGDTILSREGKDLMNEWHCLTTNNKINKTELTENKAQNFKDGLEWYEKWYKSPEESYAKKWGKSIYEEWEEDWIEAIENGETVRKCNKKCKKLLEDKEWKESWTEKNGENNDNEKTCYKMNREGNEKYEHYWGDIKLNYLDNKRMNYDELILNDAKKKESIYYY